MTQRVRVEYFDQNESFAPLLPRSGVVERFCSDIHGNLDWLLLRLDEPFEHREYQMKVGEPFRLRLFDVGHFLIRSRWVGSAIGDEPSTSVFILLVERGSTPIPEPFDPSAFVHIAWGMAAAEAERPER